MSTFTTWVSAHIVLIGKLAFIVMVISIGETTKVPLKLWLVGYAVLCILEPIFILHPSTAESIEAVFSQDSPFTNSSKKKSIEAVKSTLKVIWWIIGSYWMYSGGKMLANDAPNLFWLTAVLLSIDLVVVAFFFVIACCIFVVGGLIFALVALIVKLFKRENEAYADVLIRLMGIIYRIMREQEEMNRPYGETPEPYGDDQGHRRRFRRVVVVDN